MQRKAVAYAARGEMPGRGKRQDSVSTFVRSLWGGAKGGAREEAPLSSPAFGGMEGNTARSAVRNTHRADKNAECHIPVIVSNEGSK